MFTRKTENDSNECMTCTHVQQSAIRERVDAVLVH